MFKSFDDFIKLAMRTYHLDFEEAKTEICEKLKRKHLTPRMVVCYINWAGPNHLPVREIARYTNTDRTGKTVVNDLFQLRGVWPHLFRFGPKIPKIQDMAKLPEDFDEYLEEGKQIEKF